MRRIQIALLLLVAVLFFQCQKEPAYVGGPDPVTNTPEPVIAHLQGNVFDENGQPASGVTIKVGSKTVQTNASGYFRINDATLDKQAALVSAEKGGYFKAYRTFSAGSGTNQVEIKLIKRTSAGTVSATSGGDASLANGAKITLPANGIVVASSGAAYQGTVNVYASYIDPTSGDIDRTVPGSFMADDKNGARVLLTSYGMMAVELEGSAGEKLQIKSGSVANLTTPIPASAQATAPSTIPMWYVDDASGLWKEEGTATKRSNVYVADVKHFTYWNCDLPVSTIYLKAVVKDANGQPMVHTELVIRPAGSTYGGSAHGFTDSLGQVNGPVPANMNLELQIKDLCGNVVYKQNIGPFTQNTDLGTITIPGTIPSYVSIKGKLQTCSGTNVTNGYAIIILDNRVHYAATDATGNFSTNYLTCTTNSSASIIGVDGATQQQGNPVTVQLTAGVNNTGSISACGVTTNQFINYTIDGTNYSISSTAQDSLTAFASSFGQPANLGHSITGQHSNTSIHLEFTTPATGGAASYTLQSLRLQSGVTSLVQPFTIVITNYPSSAGQFYEGNFTGQYRDSTGSSSALHNISATFKVRRLQ